NLDGIDAPYSLEALHQLSDVLYPHCALFFISNYMSGLATLDINAGISDEEKANRKEVAIDKLIGAFEDILTID
ncbi:hypothetical protein PENTCL1PPCAC_14448, partial [Pristionchus entomophagus]